MIVPASLLGQQTGSITGTVLDPSGSALPKATVVIHRASGSVSKQASTDGQGQFSVDSLPVGAYTVEVTSQGFASVMRTGVQVTAGQPSNISVQLSVGSVSQQVTVSAADSDSIAAQLSPIQVPFDAESPRSEFGTEYINQFSSPVSDYGTVLQMAPGTFSISPNGIGLGQDKTYSRGFADGNYDITWDGIPFNDTNGPTHHSWAFFPSQWLGGITSTAVPVPLPPWGPRRSAVPSTCSQRTYPTSSLCVVPSPMDRSTPFYWMVNMTRGRSSAIKRLASLSICSALPRTAFRPSIISSASPAI